MERKFYTNDFEQLLKENADQFKMSPSKKVWHGIYNDIHPGRRWPSVAISLLFIFTLVLVGYLNIDQSHHGTLPTSAKFPALQKNNKAVLSQNTAGIPSQKNTLLKRKAVFNTSRGTNKSLKGHANDYVVQLDKKLSSGIGVTSSQKNSVEKTLAVSIINNKPLLINGDLIYKTAGQKGIIPSREELAIAGSQSQNKITTTKEIQPLTANNLDDNIFIKASATVKPAGSLLTTGTPGKNEIEPATIDLLNNADQSVKDEGKNKVATVIHLKKRRNSKINWVYYVSPGISYRTYSNQHTAADQPVTYNNSSNLNGSVIHHVSPGLEAGTALKYSLSKKLKFTSGFQVNYSAYTSQANNIHPMIASLILHDQNTGIYYPFSSISYFGNGPGNVPVNLHNYSVRLSIPLGLEYQLAGNERVQFSAAASFQPAFVIANKSYILSTDRKNYLTDASLARNWNMGTNIGTFISFNSNKLNWQIGPQVHYQLLSSYKNEYQFREHFIDYSIRFAVGIIK